MKTEIFPRGRQRAALYAASGLSLGLLISGFLLGYHAMAESPAPAVDSAAVAATPFWDAFTGVLARNLPALCLAFSGAVTAGLSTLISWPLVAIYIGSTWHLSEKALGRDQVFAGTGLYAPAEFLALATAAAAGLLPLVSAVWSALSSAAASRPFRAYLEAVPAALKLLAVAVAILLVAAGVEAAVMAGKGTS